MRIAVVGSGYVGLVTGAGFAEFGNNVVCLDVDADKVRLLSEGVVPIHEPGLDALIGRNRVHGRLRFSTAVEDEVGGAEVVFIAVGTPPRPDGEADLAHVDAAAAAIGRGLRGFTVVALKSTVPVGTGERVAAILERESGGREFAVAANPEFLTEGDAVNDFMKPSRVLIGTGDARARDVLHHLYAPMVRTRDRVLDMDARSAELAKYAANAMLATRISFMNEMARLCESLGADVEQVRQAIGWDDRIGPRYLFPGPGAGGSCLPKDLRALARIGRASGTPLQVVEAVEEVNRRQKRVLGEKLLGYFGGDLRGKVIAVWGLAFKPRTDDIREAPALTLIEMLLEAGARVRAHDPVANAAVARIFADRIEYCASPYDAVDRADALVLVTEWPELRRPDFARIKAAMRHPLLLDGRNVWDPARLRALGFSYAGIGRP